MIESSGLGSHHCLTEKATKTAGIPLIEQEDAQIGSHPCLSEKQQK